MQAFLSHRSVALPITLSGIFLLLSASSFASVPMQACPAGIDANDCVANDLQPTGAEVISGPSACTEGEIFAATVRVLFDNGGGANERYSVGFYVGEAGDLAIGGEFCTFDSLAPISNSPNPLGGPYAELNGDQCGDISKSDPTWKDIQIDRLACKDDDGDGKVDLSYVLSWVNNGNNESCQNPLDPAEFEPAPPKCLSALNYDLPIDVEEPPSIDVAKGATPGKLEEPGGSVSYPITIINDSPSNSDPVTITSLVDQVEGEDPVDITGQVTCDLPFTLAPGQSKTCIFTGEVTGVADDVITDTVTVYGNDDEGEPVEDSDSAEVVILPESGGNSVLTGDLRLVKFVAPSAVNEPGGTVQYDVIVANASRTPVTLTSLVDDLYGDLDGKGSCSVPQTLSGLNSIYFCAFEEQISGTPGTAITDTITAQGVDSTPEANELSAMDSATVTINNVPSSIKLNKIANTESVPEPGGSVTYSLQVQNTSVVDTVTINTLLDSAVGVPPGNCSTPFTLAPGETYACSYPAAVSGSAGESFTNVVVATGTDDDGQLVAGLDAASVFITGLEPELQLVKLAIPGQVDAGGGEVTYLVAIHNASGASDPVTITSLVDSVDGVETSLDGLGTCSLTDLVLQPPPGAASFYVCRFSQTLPAGTAGDTVVDTVTALGEDDEGTAVTASNSATVTYVDDPTPTAFLGVAKVAAPGELQEPGGDVTFTVYITNASEPGDADLIITLQSLTDDVFGDLSTQGDCGALIGQQLASGEVLSCSFQQSLSGQPGEQHVDTVTASGVDALDRPVSAAAMATVTFADVPAQMEVSKTANPTVVDEPGADVNFRVVVYNTSQSDAITLDSLVDNVHGDLLAQGLCPLPSPILPGQEPYLCDFTAEVSGPGGSEELNTITAFATDDDGQPLQASAQASVSILDYPASITTKKTASRNFAREPGASITFTFTTTNTSPSDVVTLDTLQDSEFGDLNGQGDCTVPQVLQPGAAYVCSFETLLEGEAGETHLNEVLVSGESDDGNVVSDRAVAIVRFIRQSAEEITARIPVLDRWGLGVLALLLGWLGYVRFRNP